MRRYIYFPLSWFIVISSFSSVAAQVLPDKSLGTIVDNSQENQIFILGGKRKNSLLFHSFKNFSSKRKSINFVHNPSVNVIIGRVTGSKISNISSDIIYLNNASLILLNPNGFSFSSPKSINFSGSFIASTARYLNFGNKFKFSTDLKNEVLIPAKINSFANNFSIPQSKKGHIIIKNLNDLTVSPGKSFSLLANNISILNSTIVAPQNDIYLGNASSGSEIKAKFSANKYTLKFKQNTNDINSQINMSNAYITSNGIGAFEESSGKIKINTGNLTLTSGSWLDAINYSGAGGNIEISSKAISLDDSVISTDNLGDASPGDVILKADSISLSNGSFVNTATFAGTGDAGDIKIYAKDKLIVQGGNDINFSLIDSATFEEVGGDAGNIYIDANYISLLHGGIISSETNGSGDAGDIIIPNSNLVNVSGVGEEGRSRIVTRSRGNGPGGDIKIGTNYLFVQDSGFLSTSSTDNAPAGNIEIDSNVFLLTNSAQVLSETTGGKGNITLNNDLLTILDGESKISVNAINSVDGGNIEVDTGALIGLRNSDITANANEGTGGNIDVQASTLAGFVSRGQLTGFSDIVAQSEFGIDGIVDLQVSEDPGERLAILPETLIEAEDLVDNSCTAYIQSSKSSTFSSYSKGRAFYSPEALLNAPNNLLTWIAADHSHERQVLNDDSIPSMPNNQTNSHEANTWIQANDGRILLVSSSYFSRESLKDVSNLAGCEGAS